MAFFLSFPGNWGGGGRGHGLDYEVGSAVFDEIVGECFWQGFFKEVVCF